MRRQGDEIVREAGTVYDPAVVQCALRAADELRQYVGRIVIDGTARAAEPPERP